MLFQRRSLLGVSVMVAIAGGIVMNLIEMVNHPTSVWPLGVGAFVPAFSLPTPDGGTVSFPPSRDRRHFTLVVFWASWCGPCMREIPQVVQLKQKLGLENLSIIAVNVEGDREGAKALPTALLPWLRVAMDDGVLAQQFGVQTLPHLVLINPSRRVSFIAVGSKPMDWFELQMQKALREGHT